LNKEPPGFVTG